MKPFATLALLVILSQRVEAQTVAEALVIQNSGACAAFGLPSDCTDTAAKNMWCDLGGYDRPGGPGRSGKACASVDDRQDDQRVFATQAAFQAFKLAPILKQVRDSHNDRVLEKIRIAYRAANQAQRDAVCADLGLPAAVCR